MPLLHYELGNPFERARANLQRCAERLEEATPDAFLAELMNAVEICKSNPYINSILLEQEAELEHERTRYYAHATRLFAELRCLKEDAIKLGPRSEAPPPTGIPKYDNAISIFDSAQLETANLEAFGATRPSQQSMKEHAQKLRFVLLHLDVGKDEELQARVSHVEEQCDWLERHRDLALKRYPYAAWLRILQYIDVMDPARRLDDGLNVFQRLMMEVEYQAQTASPITEADAHSQRIFREERAKELSRDFRRVADGIEVRLGARASYETVLRRYARRCELFRAEELRAMLESVGSTRKKEKRLVIDAATFLHDQGVDVHIEQVVGAGRTDVTATSGLLIEGKIYDNPSSGLRNVVQGLRQILDYAPKLQVVPGCTDNYLLVYRIGGSQLVLPTGPLRFGETTISLVQVNIAPPTETASRSKGARTVSIEELIAEVDAMNNANGGDRILRQQKGRAPATRRGPKKALRRPRASER